MRRLRQRVCRAHQEQALPGLPAGGQQAARRRLQAAQARGACAADRQRGGLRGLRQGLCGGGQPAALVQGLRAGGGHGDGRTLASAWNRRTCSDEDRRRALRNGLRRKPQMRSCAQCGRAFEAMGGVRYCCEACRAAGRRAYRRGMTPPGDSAQSGSRGRRAPLFLCQDGERQGRREERDADRRPEKAARAVTRLAAASGLPMAGLTSERRRRGYPPGKAGKSRR